MSSGSVNNGGTKPSINASVNIKSNGIVDAEMTFFLNKNLSIKPLKETSFIILINLSENQQLSEYFDNNSSIASVTNDMQITIVDHTPYMNLLSPTQITITEYGIKYNGDQGSALTYNYVIYNGNYYVLEKIYPFLPLYYLYLANYADIDTLYKHGYPLSQTPLSINATIKNSEFLGDYLIMFPKKIGCNISTDSIFFNYKRTNDTVLQFDDFLQYKLGMPAIDHYYNLDTGSQALINEQFTITNKFILKGLQNINTSLIGADKISLMYLDGVTGEWSEPISMSYNNGLVLGTNNDLSFIIYYIQQEITDIRLGRTETSCYYLNNMTIAIINETIDRTIYICDIVICIENQSVINSCKANGSCQKINVKINELNPVEEIIS